MQIRVGYELSYQLPQATPMLVTLHIHSSRVSDIIVPDHLVTEPLVPIRATGTPSAIGSPAWSLPQVSFGFRLTEL